MGTAIQYSRKTQYSNVLVLFLLFWVTGSFKPSGLFPPALQK